MTALDRVSNGVALLDLAGPPNWFDMIDVEWLHMDIYNRCVLGQIYGCYGYGMDRLFGGAGWSFEKVHQSFLHGFVNHCEVGELWKEAILARRAALGKRWAA